MIDFFAELTDPLHDPCLLLMLNGGMIAANKAACKMLKLSWVEAKGKNFLNFTANPDDLLNYLLICSKRRGQIAGSVSINAGGDSPIKYDCYGFRVRFERGKIVIFIRCYPRTSASKKLTTPLSQQAEKQGVTQQKIAAAKKDWEETFDALEDIVTIHDMDMNIIRANKVARELFGSDYSEIIGKKCHVLFHDCRHVFPHCPSNGMKAEKCPAKAEIYLDKFNKTMEFTTCPIFDERGNITRFVHVVKDISQSLELQKQLRQAQKMEAIGTLAGGIAHDFNNILTPILGYAELALTQAPPDTPLANQLNAIIKSAERARGLVKQILTFSRKVGEEKKSLQLQPVLKEGLKLIRASVPTSIEIVQHIDKDCEMVMADPTQIHQVLMNLCTNAYHALKEQTYGVISVSLASVTIPADDPRVTRLGINEGRYALLQVKDNGCGMDEQVLARIFEPYFTTKAQGEGTGLGLAVVHGIVEGHGGKIEVSSKFGEGSVFSVYLPTIQLKEMKPGDEETEIIGGNERILLIDDELDVVNLEAVILESLGYKTIGAATCDEALKILRLQADELHLVLTDMTMPRMNGIQMLQEIRDIRPDIPVILCTGFSDLVTADSATQYGFNAYLAKPLARKELAKTVRNVLDGSGNVVD